ncbi:two-component regulator propeller domain-containing protein [Acidobacterium capsulatum]|uniref:sensor histidine kinase n=1 Tax=Acidobacterium capsulatum TaxID=33075 RepID=UPI00145FA36A|nr:sensor histidine kinase [Acidobacterium capsulatum]
MLRWFAILLLVAAGSAPTPCAGEVPLQHEVLTTWTTAQGLPQNFITALAQTPDGFLWVGTMNGLVRFDGLHFQDFTRNGPPELEDDIGALVRDSGDGLWVSAFNGFFHYVHHRFVPILLHGRRHYTVQSIARTLQGGVWISSNGKVYRTQNDQLIPATLPMTVHSPQDMTVDREDNLWITDRANVYRMHLQANRLVVAATYPLPGCQLLYTSRFGTLWAGDGHHLFRFDGNSFARVHHPGLGNFVGVMVDRQHRLWMASGGLHGISRESNGHVETLTASQGLASDDARVLFEDRNNDIWIGTIAGLQRLHHGAFTTYTDIPGLAAAANQTDAAFEQSDHSIWGGTLEGGVIRFKNGQWSHFGRSAGLPPGQVRGFYNHGNMPAIAIADYGIFVFHGGRFIKMRGIPHGYVSNPVNAPDGSVWFSIQHRGLFRLQHDRVTHITAGQGFPGNFVGAISVDPHGDVWVGGARKLHRWNGTHFQNLVTAPAPILCIAWPAGGLALGTMDGLLLRTSMKRNGRMLTQKDGLPGDMILDVVGDSEGNLWIATTRVIARISRVQWQAFANGQLRHIDPEIFTEADGLKSRSLLPMNSTSALRSTDGRIWFATPKGLAVVNPHLIPEPRARAVTNTISVDDRLSLATSSITVPPGRHRLTLTYTAPASIAPEQVRFRYRLSGWDHKWINGGTAHEVSYTGLPPGSYAFQVIAIGRDGNRSLHPATVHITLQPFFWQTGWFLACMILLAAAALVEATRRLTHRRAERLSMRFQERVAERERIAYQIHDTVIQDMIGATLQLELIGFQIAEQPETSGKTLAELAGRMRETIARSRNMVSNLHSTAVTQYSLADVLRHAEAEFRLSELPHFEMRSFGLVRKVHPLIRDEVYRICREALANAFRHSQAENVTVTVSYLPDMLEVTIADNGQGMSQNLLEHGRTGHFGLRGMQAHAQRINASLTIESSPGDGTKVILRVKTSRFWHMRRKD